MLFLSIDLCNIKTARKSLAAWQISVKNRKTNTSGLLQEVCFLCQHMKQCVIVIDIRSVNDDWY